jgi:NADPH-dependent curcumin reductase CurA
MAAMLNRQWRLRRRPEPGELISDEHFEWAEEPLPTPGEGQLLTRTLCLGTSPAQRSYISSGPSMHDKVQLGQVMRGRGVAVVVDSRHPDFAAGDIVVASTGWQDYSLQDASASGILAVRKITDPVKPYSSVLGALGAAGLTAYFGLLRVGELKPGDTVVVYAAAGGIGSTAVQIARAAGAARVIGIAGGEQKCAWLRDHLGIAETIDYRTTSVTQQLATMVPNGINVFFDNVGGDILNDALDHLALNARIVICGFIATDYATGPVAGPANYQNLVRRRARMEGFFVFDYADEFPAAEAALKAWFRAGRLISSEDIQEGLQHMPAALQSLFTGANRGIKLCRVASDPD